jgi:hypothetical protein
MVTRTIHEIAINIEGLLIHLFKSIGFPATYKRQYNTASFGCDIDFAREEQWNHTERNLLQKFESSICSGQTTLQDTVKRGTRTGTRKAGFFLEKEGNPSFFHPTKSSG